MVHGLGGAATNWTDLMGLLDDRLHSIAPDLPGFGWSPPPPDGDYSVRAHARALAALLESVGDGRPVHLLGNSLGGTVALVVAADPAAPGPHADPGLAGPAGAAAAADQRAPAGAGRPLGRPAAGPPPGPVPGRAAGAGNAGPLLRRPVPRPAAAGGGGDDRGDPPGRARARRRGDAAVAAQPDVGLPATGDLAAVAARRARHGAHPARLRPPGPAGRPAHRDPRREGDPRAAGWSSSPTAATSRRWSTPRWSPGRSAACSTPRPASRR